MLRTIFSFELKYWLSRYMVYIFLAVVTILILAAASTDQVQIGGALENSYGNAPFVILKFYSFIAVLTCLMTTAFVNDAASRDFAHQTHQLIFTKPINKMQFLLGRFCGAVIVALIPILGVSIGLLLAPIMPWNNDPSRFCETNWSAHLWGILNFALPNTIFISAIVFAIAVWMRSTFASFIGIILLMMFLGIAESIVGNLENETLAQLLDPFGSSTFDVATKYWTVADRNTEVITLLSSKMLLLNRIVWLGVGLAIFSWASYRFSFAERRKKSKKTNVALAAASNTNVTIPSVQFNHGFSTRLQQFFSQFKVDFFSTIKSPVFLVTIFAGVIDTAFSLRTVASEGFGLSALPVTYTMIDIIRGSLFVYMMVVIIFYTGVLVWKERESKLDEVYDALPHATWISYSAKLCAILAIILIALCAETAMGVINQAMVGYDRFQLDVYFKELFLITFSQMFCFTVLAFFCHIVSPNKYIGYFSFVILAVTNLFIWGWLDVQTNLLQFAGMSSHIYSDMFGFAPFAQSLSWFGSYWSLFAVLLSCFAILFWQRGRDKGFFQRIKLAFGRFEGGLAVTTTCVLVAWLAVGSWIFYNTKIVNEIQSEEQTRFLQSTYEKEFKQIEDLPQPSITSVRYNIDVFPKKRGLVLNANQTIENKSEQDINRLWVNLTDGYETELKIDNATLAEEREDLNLKIYDLNPPLKPGESSKMEFTVSYFAKGFENSVSHTDIVQNGTFFNNSICPQFGYNKAYELTEKNDRKEFGLSEENQLMPELDPTNQLARSKTYINNINDWIDVETTISTSADQIAIAPGSLVKEWKEDGRRYFHYKVDHPSLNFYSFISADYKVKAGKWKGIDVEVYYHQEHEWNVDKMARSITKSLEYYTNEFGPYKHKQARIIEFPRVATFAQAFPGTMPYSEGIGFIADIKDEENDIDMVYYVVAHEMAHQWWAHQVIGANMLGATLLSETLAQYSALMVMEKEYGRDMMRKFLKFEMDNYLSSRGLEMLKERPLQEVAASQGYVHYRKGSVVMYYIREMVGEDKVNAALRSLVDKFAYNNESFPTSVDLIDALREQMPEDMHYLLTDLFEKITLFENRTTETTYRELENGKYEVTVDLECVKVQADDQGAQKEVEINDWIEIGAFAKPEGESEFGKTLYRERVRIQDRESQFKFIVDEVPGLAGVDPFSLLIDRMPDDNMKPPTKIE